MGFLTGYYLAGTVAFVTVDLVMGWSMRVPGLEEAPERWGYYLALLALGWVMHRRPATAPWIGMGESVVNLTLLFLSVLLPVWNLPETLESGLEPAEVVLAPARLAGVFLSGVILILSFHEARSHLGARLVGGDGDGA